MNSPMISIALATYNGEKFVEKQINSLLNQDYSRFEIVISDDCSTDGTWEILRNYASKDGRIRLLPRDFNRGYVENFIRVFMACKGEFIAPSDQDDIWLSNKISRLFENIGDASLIYCDSFFIDENDDLIGRNLSATCRMIAGIDPNEFLCGNSVSGHAMLFRKNLLQATNKLNSAAYIDWMLAFLAAKSNGIKYLDEALVGWRHHGNSTTSHAWNMNRSSRIKILENDRKTLAAFASIPGRHQSLAIEGLKKLDAWTESYFSLGMFIFVLRHGSVTHKASRARIPALKYLAGNKMKKMLRPKFY